MTPGQIKYYWIYLLYLLATIAVASYDLLPEKKLQLLSDEADVSLFMDSDQYGTSIAEWVDKDKRHFRCTFDKQIPGAKYCGLNIKQGDGSSSGVDFSNYKRVRLKLSKPLTASYVRLFIRNFVQQYSSHLNSDATSKYLRVLIPVRELDRELDLEMRQFTLAEWWIQGVTLPAKLAYPELDNVVNIGVDFPHPIREGPNELQVDSITLVGVWVSRENWYLAIFISCFVILLFTHLIQGLSEHRLYD